MSAPAAPLAEPNAPPRWAPLPELSEAARAAIAREALRVNDRYLHEVIEGWAFCPFAREGRLRGETARHVHLWRGGGVEELLPLFEATAARKEHAVTQVILPLLEAGPEEFSAFCHRLTAAGNARLRTPALACAPLHPELAFGRESPFALVPLFRRAPDPTIQWVRLDGLEAIYAGRTSGTVCPTPEELERLLREGPGPPRKLYDRVAETNAQMARRLGIDRVAGLLRAIADEGRRGYARILLGAPEAASGARP